MTTVPFSLLSLLVLTTVVFSAAAYNQHKAEVIDGNAVEAVSNKNDTFSGGLGNDNKTVGGHFINRNGIPGDVNATFVDVGNRTQYVEAYSGGEKQSVDINSGRRKAHVVSTGGDTVDADLNDGKHIIAVVKPLSKNGTEKTYSIDRIGDDKVVVHKPEGGKDLVLTGLSSKQKVNIQGGNYPAVAKWGAKNYLNETPQVIGARYGENIVPKANLGQVKDVRIVTDEKTAGGKLTISDSYGKVDADPVGEQKKEGAVLKADNVRITSCLTEGKQDVLSDTGFKLIDKSIGIDYPPVEYRNGHPVYAFPACFLVKATLQIPPKVDIRNVAVQAVVYIYPLGNLQCDRTSECSDWETIQRPPGSCFYCNLCKNDTETRLKDVLGTTRLSANDDVCITRKTQLIPIEVKVCPPENVTKEDKQNLFMNDLFKDNAKGDVDMELKIFQKKGDSDNQAVKSLCFNPVFKQNNEKLCSNTKKQLAWDLEGCRKVRMSYSFGGELLKELTNKFSALLSGHGGSKR